MELSKTMDKLNLFFIHDLCIRAKIQGSKIKIWTTIHTFDISLLLIINMWLGVLKSSVSLSIISFIEDALVL